MHGGGKRRRPMLCGSEGMIWWKLVIWPYLCLELYTWTEMWSSDDALPTHNTAWTDVRALLNTLYMHCPDHAAASCAQVYAYYCFYCNAASRVRAAVAAFHDEQRRGSIWSGCWWEIFFLLVPASSIAPVSLFCVCRRNTPALTVQYVQLSLSSPVVDQLRRFSNRWQ